MAVVTTQQSVAALYTAIFNRAPDQAGLTYWTAQIDAGASFASVAAGFAQHEVFTSGIGALDNAAYVAALYTNILGSAGDAAGIAYWTDRLAAGESKASVVASFVEGSLTIDLNALLADGSLSQADFDLALVRQQSLTNKADVGIYFANTLGAASNLNPATVSTSKAGLEADPIYKASQAAIANVDSTAASVQTAKDAVAVAAGSADPAKALLGQTFALTAGADTFVGGASADVFNALSIKADGTPGSTLTGFDSIDGGAGKDTLNIYTDAANGINTGSLANVTVKNVETINFLNASTFVNAVDAVAVDASKFVGATTINQTGFAAELVKLAATTTAVFSDLQSRSSVNPIKVGAADAAASATIALDNVSGNVYSNRVHVDVDGLALSAVNISGSIVIDADSHTTAAPRLALDITAGKDVQTVTLNTSLATDLSVAENFVTKHVTTVDTSAGVGAVTFSANSNVANIITGTGNDVVSLNTALTATVKAASISTGAGDDIIYVNANVATAATGQTVTVDAGEGKDNIYLGLQNGIGYNVAAGAGDDTVYLTGTVKSTDKVDGGAGTDTVSLTGKATLVADDYIVYNKVLTNFETLQLTGTATSIDAGQLAANYTTIDLYNGSTVTHVGTQALIANAALTATAAGYTAGAGAVATVYAGSLNITEKASGTVTASADSAALTVTAGTAGVAAILAGDVKTASVSLVNSVDNATTPTADTIASVTVGTSVSGVTNTGFAGLTTLTLTGNGSATVYNGAADKLTTVDASGLGGVFTLGATKGAAITGLTYSSANSAAETIKLGAGIDHITLNASTYGKVDVVSGLNLVASAADAKVADFTKSDSLNVGGITSVVKFTTTQTDLALALKDAAAFSLANTGANLVFQQGGNTYVFHDAAVSGSAGNGLIDGADTVVQLTGQVNLDLLSSALMHNVA